MSGGFSFPPPPPPPPKPRVEPQQHVEQSRGRGRGRGGSSVRGDVNQRGRGGRGGGRSSSNQTNHGGTWPSNQGQYPPSEAAYQLHSLVHQRNSTPNVSGLFASGSQTSLPGSLYGHHVIQASPTRTTAGHKRKLDALREPQRTKLPGPQTAPAVPNFGGPILPMKQVTPARTTETTTNAAKPRSVGRGLGLVPLVDDATYDDSESEDDKDVDEEAMYAELGDKLTFEHNGVVMSLKSEADLAAWKRERQRNWPTNARMSQKDEARRRIGEERRRLLAGAALLQRPLQTKVSRATGRSPRNPMIAEAKTRLSAEHSTIEEDSLIPSPYEAAAEATYAKPEIAFQASTKSPALSTVSRAEQLAELRKKVAASEAKNREARNHINPTRNEANTSETAETNTTAEQSQVVMEVDPWHDEHVDDDTRPALGETERGIEDVLPESPADVSSDLSSESETVSEDSGPEEVASKPPAVSSEGCEPFVCRYFAATGHCRDGDACRFKHVQRSQRVAQAKERQVKRQEAVGGGEQKDKKTIFQRLVEQEQADVDRLALQVIKYLGKAGLFSVEEVSAAY